MSKVTTFLRYQDFEKKISQTLTVNEITSKIMKTKIAITIVIFLVGAGLATYAEAMNRINLIEGFGDEPTGESNLLPIDEVVVPEADSIETDELINNNETNKNDTTLQEQLFNVDAMHSDENPPFGLENGDIVCDECSSSFMSRFNDGVPAFAKNDLIALQTKLVAQGVEGKQLDQYMMDAMIQQSSVYDVDLQRGIGENETGVVNANGTLTISSNEMDDRIIPAGDFSVDKDGTIRLSSTGSGNALYNPNYVNSNNGEFKDFMKYYEDDGSKPTKVLFAEATEVVPAKTTIDPYKNFDYKQFELTKEEWNALSPQEKEAVASSVGYDVNEASKIYDAELLRQKAVTDSLQRIVDKNKGN